MKSYIKQILSLILTIVPVIAIVFGVVYFLSDKYLIKTYYEMAVNNYSGVSGYSIAKDSIINGEPEVYAFSDGDYYRISNYETVLDKYVGEAQDDFKEYSHVKEYSGNYYVLSYNTNSIEGYTKKYTYEAIEDTFTSKTYKIISYFCDTSDLDVDCDLDTNEGIYTVETEFSIIRKGFTWKITKFEMPKALYKFIDTDEEPEGLLLIPEDDDDDDDIYYSEDEFTGEIYYSRDNSDDEDDN